MTLGILGVGLSDRWGVSGWAVGWFMVGLGVASMVVEVVELFSLAFISISPSQLYDQNDFY